jgi:hypothetical protein
MPQILPQTRVLVPQIHEGRRVSIDIARQLSRNLGSEIQWRPLNLAETAQFAIVMGEGQADG